MSYVANTSSREALQEIELPLWFERTKEQEIRNFYPLSYVNEHTGTKENWLQCRPGISVDTTLSTTSSDVKNRGLYYWNKTNLFYTVFGNDLDRFASGGASTNMTSSFTGDSKYNYAHFTEYFDGSNYFLAVKKTNITSQAYIIDSSNTLTQITSSNYPSATAVGQFVSLDGYLFVITSDGKIYNSDLGSPTSWNSTSFIQCNISTDGGIGLAKYKNQIVAFNSSSIEFFYNAANATGSPLSRNEQAAILGIGCINAKTIVEIQDSLFWIAPAGAGKGIYTLDGFKAKKVSTPFLDRDIQAASAYNDEFYAGFISLGESNFYYYSIVTYTILGSSTYLTQLYDVTHDLWLTWSCTGGGLLEAPFGIETTANPGTLSLVPSCVVTSSTVSSVLGITYFPSIGNSTNKYLLKISPSIAIGTDTISLPQSTYFAIKTKVLNFDTANAVRIHKISAYLSSDILGTSFQEEWVSRTNFGRYKNVYLIISNTGLISGVSAWTFGTASYGTTGITHQQSYGIVGRTVSGFKKIKIYYSLCEH